MKLRRFKSEDDEIVSKIIRRNLLEINIKDYSEEKIQKLYDDFSPEKIIELSKKREMIVAEDNGEILGTASLGNYGTEEDPSWTIYTVFVLPEKQKKGIGTKLINKIEKIAKEKGYEDLTVPASISSHKFYYKLGYNYIDSVEQPTKEGVHLMNKKL